MASDFTAVRATRAVTARNTTNKITSIATQAQFEAMVHKAPSVTAGTPMSLKFLVDRKTKEIYFVPEKWLFHFDFAHDVLDGSLNPGRWRQLAYDRPDRRFIPGSVTRYDSFVDPVTGEKGKLCFSLWPTDRFDTKVLQDAHAALKKGLTFLPASKNIAFRPGGPIQDDLVKKLAPSLKAAKLEVTSNLEISKHLKFMALSTGESVGKLVVIEKGQAAPALGRGDVALFLGDVPVDAPPVAGVMTTQVQTYNSHLGIKYRQDDTPFFYKAFTDAEITELRALNGKYVKVTALAADGKAVAATEAEAKAYLESIRPAQAIRLKPNLAENKALSLDELHRRAALPNGKWNRDTLGAFGRKTMGLVELMGLERSGKLQVNQGNEPDVVTPKALIGIPANWYTRFIREAKDPSGQTFSQRIEKLTSNPKFGDAAWRAPELAKLRADITNAAVPPSLVKDVREQVAAPYLAAMPGIERARLRSSSPVVEDGGGGNTKLPNMAGAFDSNTARWQSGRTPAATLTNATAAMVDTLKEEYASVWNDRAVSELEFNRVALDEESVTMSVSVIPNENDEQANGVIRVNPDLAGFFSITGETQFGDALVTNPEGGAIPDTWIDGNYDQSSGQPEQDISYERHSNLPPPPGRPRAFSNPEISSTYKAMKVIRDHFAKLEGKVPEQYVDEIEVKINSEGQLLIKQERPWLE